MRYVAYILPWYLCLLRFCGPFFTYVVCFLTVGFWEIFVSFGHKSLLRYIFCKCVFQVVGGLSLNSLSSITHTAAVLYCLLLLLMGVKSSPSGGVVLWYAPKWWKSCAYRICKPNKSKCFHYNVAVCKRLNLGKMIILLTSQWTVGHQLRVKFELTLILRELWREGSSTLKTWSWKGSCGRKGKKNQNRKNMCQLEEDMAEDLKKTSPTPWCRLYPYFERKGWGQGNSIFQKASQE